MLFAAAACSLATTVNAQMLEGTNVDESKVPAYALPDPLRMEDGSPVDAAEAWTQRRRPEILELFRSHVYGRSPERPLSLHYEVLETGEALGGRAVRKQVRVWLGARKPGPAMDLLLYLPSGAAAEPVPAFLALNFDGNHTLRRDRAIRLPEGWVANDSEHGITDNRASERSRGARVGRWAVEAIVERGFALATAYYGDVDPDFHDGFRNGVHGLHSHDARDAGSWGSLAAWAWGLSRALDYLEREPGVDASRVAVMGHSRLGKAALWAGASDERFALVISNDSGCGGAALSRRRFGETVGFITQRFPHWFAARFAEYAGNEDALPVDQHQLIALIAPRPVYVASAAADLWADPRGEFLAAQAASPVYALLGREGLPEDARPVVGEPLSKTSVGYHVRAGEHDVTAYDWEQYLSFAEKWLKSPDP